MNTILSPNPPNNAPSILSSADVAGIELRMLPPYIRNNHTLRIWPLPGRAKLYCLTLVLSDAANQLNGLMDLNAFPRIGNNTCLPINKTIYYWECGAPGAGIAPNQLHVLCSVIKSKEALREAGTVLASVKEDDEYKDLLGQLSSLAGDAASFNAVSGLTLQLGTVIGRYLGRVDDQPLGTIVQSFTRLHGDWDRLGITPVTASTGDVDFSFELVIRDNERPCSPAGGEGVILPGTRGVASAAEVEMMQML